MSRDEIYRPSFTPIGRGAYKTTDVDEYIKKVASFCDAQQDEAEALREENHYLDEKIKQLNKELAEYAKEEDNIKRTLLMAQKAATDLQKRTQGECEALFEEAQKEALELTEELRVKEESRIRESAAKAEEYLAQAEAAYHQKVSQAKQEAEKTLNEAAKKAEFILSTAKIKTAAAVEKANAAIEKAQDAYRRSAAMAARDLQDMIELITDYKEQMSVVVRKTVDTLDEIDVPELSAIELKEEDFAPISSEISEEIPDDFIYEAGSPYLQPKPAQADTYRRSALTQQEPEEVEVTEDDEQQKPVSTQENGFEKDAYTEPFRGSGRFGFTADLAGDTRRARQEDIFGSRFPESEEDETTESDEDRKSVGFSELRNLARSAGADAASSSSEDEQEELEDPYEKYLAFAMERRKTAEAQRAAAGAKTSREDGSDPSPFKSRRHDKTRTFRAVQQDQAEYFSTIPNDGNDIHSNDDSISDDEGGGKDSKGGFPKLRKKK